MADERTVLLFQSRDDRATRSLWATTLADGRLKIEGRRVRARILESHR